MGAWGVETPSRSPRKSENRPVDRRQIHIRGRGSSACLWNSLDAELKRLTAKVDVFLVNVGSDIVWDVHWVLLFEDSESALLRWSRHRNPRENPSSSHLSIQTDGTNPIFLMFHYILAFPGASRHAPA